MKRSLGGPGAEGVVLQGNGKERSLNDWSRDGRLLLFAEQGEKTQSDLWVLPVNGGGKPGEPEVFLNSEFNESQGQFSPDGKWIAYVSDETGQSQVYIQPFPRGAGTAGKIAVGPGVMPRWRRDGKELFYIQPGGGARVMAADFASIPATAVGIPRQLFRVAAAFVDARTFMWDVASAGDRFLLTALPLNTGDVEAPLTVVLNWQRMLEP